jgi:hypothetical protein
MRSNMMLASMNIETNGLANEDDKKDLFDSQLSPHSADTKATTAAMNKTMRDTMRGMDTTGRINSPGKKFMSEKKFMSDKSGNQKVMSQKKFEESEEGETQNNESPTNGGADHKHIISQLGFDHRYKYPNVQINEDYHIIKSTNPYRTY